MKTLELLTTFIKHTAQNIFKTGKYAINFITDDPKYLPLVLKGCVAWAKENGVTLIDAEHMKIINDKRAEEKKKKK